MLTNSTLLSPLAAALGVNERFKFLGTIRIGANDTGTVNVPAYCGIAFITNQNCGQASIVMCSYGAFTEVAHISASETFSLLFTSGIFLLSTSSRSPSFAANNILICSATLKGLY